MVCSRLRESRWGWVFRTRFFERFQDLVERTCFALTRIGQRTRLVGQDFRVAGASWCTPGLPLGPEGFSRNVRGNELIGDQRFYSRLVRLGLSDILQPRVVILGFTRKYKKYIHEFEVMFYRIFRLSSSLRFLRLIREDGRILLQFLVFLGVQEKISLHFSRICPRASTQSSPGYECKIVATGTRVPSSLSMITRTVNKVGLNCRPKLSTAKSEKATRLLSPLIFSLH